jgi:hypothetical protein
MAKNMSEKNHLNKVVSHELLQQLKEHYYCNISQPEKWYELILKAIQEKRNFQLDIEQLADHGTLNLSRLIKITASCFEKTHPFFFHGDGRWLELIQWFIVLHCYLHIVALDNTDTSNNLIPFFEEDFQEIFSLIYQDWRKNFEELFHQFGIEQHLTKNTLLQLIILPYINDETLTFGKIISNQDILEETLSKKINFLKQHQPRMQDVIDLDFEWLRTDDIFRQCIISAAKIFDLARQIYFSAQCHKIFGYFQRFLDKVTANVVYSITYNNQNYLLEGTAANIAGSANLEYIQILPNLDLLLSFNHGSFSSAEINEQAAFRLALVLSKFITNCRYYLNSNFILENTTDNLEFVSLVKNQLAHLNSGLDSHILVAPPLKYSTKVEKQKYITGEPLSLDQELVDDISHKFFQGRKITSNTFEGVKIISLLKDEVLFEEGSAAYFVYIPCSTGLVGYSSKAKIEFMPYPWLPVGHIGVLQNEGRTATIRAKETCRLIMIPGHVYLELWHIIHSNEQLLNLLSK